MSRESEIAAVVGELEALLGELSGNVSDLRAILESPEVPGDQPAPA